MMIAVTIVELVAVRQLPWLAMLVFILGVAVALDPTCRPGPGPGERTPPPAEPTTAPGSRRRDAADRAGSGPGQEIGG